MNTNVIGQIGRRPKAQQFSGYRWVVLVITLAVFGLSLMDRLNWAVVIPQAVPVLGWSMTQAGAMMSAFYIGYIATQIPGGALADRFGPKAILTASAFLMGLFTMGTTLAESFPGMLAFRFLAGLAAGPVFACAIKYQAGWFPSRERATAMGLFMLGPSLGTLLANSIIPAVTAQGEWSRAFLVSGGATLIVGLFVALATSDAPAGAPVTAGRGDPERPQVAEAGSRPFHALSFVTSCVAGFLLVGGAVGILTWTIAYLRSLGLEPGLAGAMMSVYGLSGMVGTFSAGLVSDLVAGGRRKAMTVGCLIAAAAMAAILGLNRTVSFFWPIVVAGGLVSVMATPPLHTYVSELSAPTGRLGTMMGIYNAAGQLGPVFFPVLLGWMLDTTGDYKAVYLTLAAALLLAALLMGTVKEVKPRSHH